MPKSFSSATDRRSVRPLQWIPAALLVLVAGSVGAQQTSPDNETIYLPGGKSLVVPAFRVYTASGYTPSDDNIAALKDAAGAIPAFRLIAFDGGSDAKGRLWCRGSFPVDAPNKLSFDSMLEAAANLEFAQAKVLGERADDKVTGHLDSIDFTSVGTGTWKIRATFSAAAKGPVTVEHTHAFELSLLATKSCANVTAALVPAVRGFWRAAYETPQFLELMGTPTKVAVQQRDH
jgi:hypothetical protein